MKALRFSRKPVKYLAASAAGRLAPGKGATVGPLELADVDDLKLPADDWVRLRPRLAGICGSDLTTIDGHASAYFEPIVSFPFTPGHEVVGDLDDGTRAVLIPVLHCATRGLARPVSAAAPTTVAALRSDTWSRGCRAGSARAAAAGGPPRWWPTPARSWPCPTSCPTKRP